MVAKLHKLDASPPARACMIACDLFHVPVEHVDVDLFGGAHRTPEYLKKNPLHTVPMLEDGDLVIHDSHVILMYIADIYNTQDSWYPKDPKQRALVNQKLFFNSTILFPRLRNISLDEVHLHTSPYTISGLDGGQFVVWMLSRQPIFIHSPRIEWKLKQIGYPLLVEGNKDVPQKNFDAIEEAYGFVEEFLSRTKYLAGNNITIADIAAYPSVTSLMSLVEFNSQKYPKTQAWLKDIGSLSSVQKHNTKGDAILKELIAKKLFNK